MSDQNLSQQITQLKSQKATLEDLLQGRERAVKEHSERLKEIQSELGERLRELAQSENRFREQNEFFKVILNHIADGVVVCDRNGKFLVFNAAAEEIVGIGSTDTRPEDWSDKYGIYLSDGITKCPQEELPLVRAMRGQDVQEAELFIRNPKKTEGVWLSVNARPLRDSGGKTQGGVAVFRDVTRQKLAEKNLREKSSELAQSEAEREQLEMFASAACHDLQEPLQKIIAFASLLKAHARELDAKSHEFIGNTQNAAVRMSQMLEGLLQFSRATLHRDPVQIVDLEVIVGEILSDLEYRIRRTKARIDIERLPCLEADQRQMRQLFQNLIVNALKFQKKDQSPHVVIKSSVLDGRLAQISVADNGIGFDPVYAEKIFKPFERLHGRGLYEGSGMGLAICQKIVTRHNGRIWGESFEGRGATFFVELPLSQPPGGSAPHA